MLKNLSLTDILIIVAAFLGACFLANRIFPHTEHTLTHTTVFVADSLALWGRDETIDSLTASDAFHVEQWTLEKRKSVRTAAQVERLAAIVKALRDSSSTPSTVPNFYATFDTTAEVEASGDGATARINLHSRGTYDIANDLFRDMKLGVSNMTVDYPKPVETTVDKTVEQIPSVPWIIGGAAVGLVGGAFLYHTITK